MIRSKASAALLRLKEIDKKYRVRYEDPKEELSSDNTESLIRQSDKEKNDKPPASTTKEQEILKPTLNIKIPETFTEQLESQSSSNEASVKVSIVDKTPVADPKIESQSVSEIQEELEDVESIAEELDDSDNSTSKIATKSPEEEIEKTEIKNDNSKIVGKNISTKEKQLQNSDLNDAHSHDYSHCSFESYSSASETESKSVSEVNESISAWNTNKNHVLLESKGILDTKKIAESIEKKKEEKTSNSEPVISEDIDENDEIIEELSKSAEATDSFINISRSSKSKRSKSTNLQIKNQKDQDESSSIKNYNLLDTKLPRDKSKQKDLGVTDRREFREEKEEITGKFAESIEKNNKVVASEITDEIDESLEESSVKSTNSFRKTSGDSEDIDTYHYKLKSKRSKRKNVKIKNEENEKSVISTKNENSSDTKLKDEHKQQQQSKSLNSSQQKLQDNRRKLKVKKINNHHENIKYEEEFSLKNKILSDEKSEPNRNKLKNYENDIQEKSEISSSSLLSTNSSNTKLSQDQSRTTDLKLVDETEKEEISSSAKEDFPHRELDNNETALFSRAAKTKQLLRETSRRFRKKSSDYSEEVGDEPTVNDEPLESRSRKISSQRKSEHNLTSRKKDAEKEVSKIANKIVQRSQSAVEIGERERKIPNIRRKKLHQSSKVHGYIKEKKRSAKTSKSSPCCRVNEMRNARKDMELERFIMRLKDLRLEQERQLMLCYMRNFEEDRERLFLWPNRFYCAGKPEAAIIKPLNFQNVLKFSKPDSSNAKVGFVFPDNHLTMLKDRVLEIRQWLKDQFILYQNYSDVAAAINAKYVAENEKFIFQIQTRKEI